MINNNNNNNNNSNNNNNNNNQFMMRRKRQEQEGGTGFRQMVKYVMSQAQTIQEFVSLSYYYKSGEHCHSISSQPSS